MISPTKVLRVLANRDCRSALIRYRVAAGVEHCSVLAGLHCATLVDIGANRGQFSLAARRCFPDARIISFEPLPGPAGVFRRVFANDPLVSLHQVAIGPQSGQTLIHVSGREDSSSLLPIALLQGQVFPGTNEVATQEVAVAPLSQFIKPADVVAPALLKLDVQGYELRALHACENLLERFAFVYVECSFVELYEQQALADEVIAWLRPKQFALSGVYNAVYRPPGRCIQADLLFTRNRAADKQPA